MTKNTIQEQKAMLNGNSLPLGKQVNLIKMDFLTVNEIFELFPEVQNKFNWKKEDLAFMLEEKLLQGRIDEKNEVLLITKESIEKLIEFRNNVK